MGQLKNINLLSVLVYDVKFDKKQNLTQSVPGHAMCQDLDDSSTAQGRLTPALSKLSNCIYVAL